VSGYWWRPASAIIGVFPAYPPYKEAEITAAESQSLDLQSALKVNVTDLLGRELPLEEYLGEGPCLISLIRHFGCISCAEYVEHFVPVIDQLRGLGINIVFIGNGKYPAIEGFIKKRGLEGKQVSVLTEPSLKLHAYLGLKRSVASVLSINSVKNAIRAYREGFRNKAIEGSNFQQSGIVFLNSQREILYHHRSECMGDNPFGEEVLKMVQEILKEQS
jgi:hypothetical protein